MNFFIIKGTSFKDFDFRSRHHLGFVTPSPPNLFHKVIGYTSRAKSKEFD